MAAAPRTPKAINVDGKELKLPLPAAKPIRLPSQEELEYMVGFFDGDGCVSIYKILARCKSIGQSIDPLEVLLLFRFLLGGSIYHHSTATGSRKAAVVWKVYGS